MELENTKYNLSIYKDNTYTIDSVDNLYYDHVFNPCSFNRNDYYSTLIVKVNNFIEEYRIAIIGDYLSHDSSCAVLEGDILTLLQGRVIHRINLQTNELIISKCFDSYGCNFEIHRVENGYIIYGEVEITMLDKTFEKLWTFSAKDIFISIENKNPFVLCDDRIKLYDFSGNYYEIDYCGKIIYSKLKES